MTYPVLVVDYDSGNVRSVGRALAAGGAEPQLSADPAIHLTRREMEVLNFLADGMTSPEIARVLSISNHTVDWYMNGIQEKLKARNRQHAVALSFRLGLIS